MADDRELSLDEVYEQFKQQGMLEMFFCVNSNDARVQRDYRREMAGLLQAHLEGKNSSRDITAQQF